MNILPSFSSPGITRRAWTGTLSPDMYKRVDQVDGVMRASHDAQGLEKLEMLKAKAVHGGFGGGLANALLAAGAVGGAALGMSTGGGLGLVLGLLGGGALSVHLGAITPKAIAEMRLGRYVDRVLATGKSGVPAPMPAVPTEPSAPPIATPAQEEIQKAMLERYPKRTERVALSSGSQALQELQSSVVKQLLYESGERIDARVHTMWSYPTSHHIASDAVYDSGRLYTRVGDGEGGRMAAFDADGLLWSTLGDGAATSPPVVANGNVHFQTNGALHVYDGRGRALWSYPTGRSNSWNDRPPAVAKDGTVYVLDSLQSYGVHDPNMRLHAVRDGQEAWHVDMTGSHTGDPQVLCGRDGTIYVTAELDERNGLFGDRKETAYLMALRPDGSMKFKAPVSFWSSYVATSLSEGPDGTVYACHGEHTLSAFTPSGKEKWAYRLVDRVVTSHSSSHTRLTQAPAFGADGSVLLSTNTCASYPEGYLISLTPDGKEQWVRSVAGGISSHPHVAPDGSIYVTTSRGDLLSFDGDGKQLSAAPVGNVSWSNFAFGDDGRLFLNTDRQIVGYHPDADKAYRREPDLGEGTNQPAAPSKIGDEGEYIVIGGLRVKKRVA